MLKLVNDFISEQELEESWQEYLTGLQEDANDASQEGKEQEDD